MANNKPATRVFLHALAIASFIILEMSHVIFVGTAAPPYVFVIFYVLDISFFLLLGLLYLPRVTYGITSYFGRVLLFGIPIICYAILIATVGDLLESLERGRLMIKITKTDFFVLFNRSLYIFVLAALYWYAKYSVRKEKDQHRTEVARLQLEKRNAQLENAYLRAQLNPHLLFNSLTVTYNRLTTKAPEEAAAVLKLADMMEYAMARPSEDGLVNLRDDLDNLECLIDLYQMQYHGALAIDFLVRMTDGARDVMVPPLLFTDLVSNIFKYGNLRDPKQRAMISVFCDGSVLQLETKNVIAGKRELGIPSGLNNTENRLQRHYPGKHSFSAGAKGDEFFVTVKIQL